MTLPKRHDGVPGVAKTLAASTLATVAGGSFARLQFTPCWLTRSTGHRPRCSRPLREVMAERLPKAQRGRFLALAGYAVQLVLATRDPAAAGGAAAGRPYPPGPNRTWRAGGTTPNSGRTGRGRLWHLPRAPRAACQEEDRAVKLTGVELRRVAMPLATPFRTAAGVETTREALLVRVVTPDGEGWGECVAMREPRYSAEYVDGAADAIRRFLVPALAALPDLRPELVGGALAGIKGHRMAKAALEMAVLDAELRARGIPLARYLGATRDRVPAGVAVGIAGSLPELLDTVAAYLDAGYQRVKLKIKPGWDVEPVRAVRERFGSGLLLQVDANGAYTLADAPHLARLDAFGLLCIEQPLDEEDLGAHAALARRLRTPVCLDEPITSARAAAAAIALGACAVVNIKAGRVGGYLEARRVHDVCHAHGVPVWCGGMLETGLGRAANAALAALPGFTLPGDLSASDRYYRQDLTEPFTLDRGHLAVPAGPGLGVTPLPEVLEEVTTAVEWLPA